MDDRSIFENDHLNGECAWPIFMMPSDTADFMLRYFTPTEEVPLCGHATIAAFSILHSLGRLSRHDYKIETKAGRLNVLIEDDGMIFMEQNHPAYFEALEPNVFVGCVEDSFIDATLPIQVSERTRPNRTLSVCII